MIDKIKSIALPILILVTSILIIPLLIPDFHPFGGLNITRDKQFIINESKKYLNKIGVQYDESKLDLNLESNNKLSRWIDSEHKINEANKILRQNGTAYYWRVSQKFDDDENDVMVSSNSSENVNRSKTRFYLNILDDGKIIGFNHQQTDSTIKKSLTPEEAKKTSIDFIQKLRDDIYFTDDSVQSKNSATKNLFYFNGAETIDKAGRVDYNFNWKTNLENKLNYSLKTQIVGESLSSFEIQVIIPPESEDEASDIFEMASTILLILLIIISVSIVGFKRFRAYEVGFKHAIAFGIFVLFSFVIKEFLEQINNLQFNIILGLGLGGIFIAGAAIILWAVSETLFREIWNPKFLSLDLIYHRKFLHSSVGKSTINSISFGFGLTALFFVLLFLVSNYSTVTFKGENFISQSHITSKLPLLNVFFGVFNSYGLLAVGFLMFLTAAIKSYINNDTIFIIVCGLTWAVLVPSNINPLTTGIPINFIIGILLTTILMKYDLLSTLLSFLLFKFLIKVTEFSFLQEPGLLNQWYLLMAVCLGFVITGIVLVLRKDKFTDYDSITPKFVENITERQRLKQELDVARHVQMSFLPKENPIYTGIDIASTCIPAFEVGGDYYDFIHLGKDKLGIIIGDVSGKGTQAAFYMTLTKGFLKALAKQTDSPSEVLTKMNELFYENVERGRFISMIYAIVDLKQRKIKIARAGHNPIIFHDDAGNINLINPDGMALGLEKGPLFSKVITEHEENLSAGKTFIFYTDGFSEAVNKKGEEYGLERMFDVAKNYNQFSAVQLQDKMIEDINKFIGKAKQHDDMTMVILKIK
jgi:phosphoserine phosphatase RsbU/P